MREDQVLADFQFLGNRVSSLVLNTKLVDASGQRANTSFDFDYNINSLDESDDQYLGIIEFIVKVKAVVGKKQLFKIELVMEGAFSGNASKMPKDRFKDMLELNGLVTLLQISRSYILSVTSQSGIYPPVKIPMINVMKLREEKARAAEENK